MNQTRLGSLIESLFNTAIGFVIAFASNQVVLPLFGFATLTVSKSLGIGAVYTLISIARSYVIRRWFNARLHRAALRLAGDA
jgi:hypothetical protein